MYITEMDMSDFAKTINNILDDIHSIMEKDNKMKMKSFVSNDSSKTDHGHELCI